MIRLIFQRPCHWWTSPVPTFTRSMLFIHHRQSLPASRCNRVTSACCRFDVYPSNITLSPHQLRYHPVLNITVQLHPNAGQTDQPVVSPDLTAQAVPEGATGVRLRLHTTQRGVYRLTYADLAAGGVELGSRRARIPTTLQSSIRASRSISWSLALVITASTPGDLVVFYAVPKILTWAISGHNVYYFVERARHSLPGMETRSANRPFAPAAASTISQTTHIRVNVDYRTLYERPKADHFFDTQLCATPARRWLPGLMT